MLMYMLENAKNYGNKIFISIIFRAKDVELEKS